MAYQWYGTVTINHAKVGTTDQTDFPVFVSLSNAVLKTVANSGKITNASGYDLAFFSDIGLATALAFEIESYDGSAGAYKAYVKVPTVSHTSDTVIYFGYADSAISTTQENVSGTWSNNFAAVWHLKDGSSLDLTNSVSGGPSLSNLGGSTAFAGLVGSGSVDTDGTNGHGLRASTAALTAYPITLEAWFNADTLANGKVFATIAGTTGQNINIQLRSTGAVRLFNGGQFVTTTATVTTGTTHYVVGTASSIDQRSIYLDGGNVVSNTTAHALLDNTFYCTIVGAGSDSGTSTLFCLDGRTDEVRISSVVRSADWITSTWNNLNDVSTFITNAYGNSTIAGNSGDVAAASTYSGNGYWNGSSRMLSIDVQILTNTRTVSSVTYGGAAATLIGVVTKNAMRLESWRIHSSDSGAPAAGNNTVAVTISGSAEFVVNWVNRQHVHATTPTEAFNECWHRQ